MTTTTVQQAASKQVSSVHDWDGLSTHAHRQLIGYTGFFLPIVLVLAAAGKPTPGLPRWQLLNSISAYYYTFAVAAFVGLLVALALFLFTYRGYGHDRFGWADRMVGKVAGLSAIGVAVFPTTAPSSLAAPLWWSPSMIWLHYVSATLLFVSFITYSLWLFRMTNDAHRSLPRDKRWRNRFYVLCGLIMIGCVLWAGSSFFTGAPIFLPEAIALEAFALSWLVKGYAHRSLLEAVKRAFRP